MANRRSSRIANIERNRPSADDLRNRNTAKEQRRLASIAARLPRTEWLKGRPKRKSCENNPRGRMKFIRQGKSWWVTSPGYCRSS